MDDIKKYYDYALTMQSAYSYFDTPNMSILDMLKVEGSSNFTTAKAQEFIDRFDVIAHQPNDDTGFSATLFNDTKDGDQAILAIRGTEPSQVLGPDGTADIEIVTFGVAFNQAISLYNYVNSLRTGTRRQVKLSSIEGVVGSPPPGIDVLYSGTQGQGVVTYYYIEAITSIQGTGKLADGEQLVVSGHSLGGHLAALASALFPGLVSDVYTYNAPGFGGIYAEAIHQITGNTSFSAFNGSVVHTLVGESEANGDDFDLTSDLRDPFSPQESIFIEVNTDGNFGVAGHSKVQIADSLKLYDVFALMDSNLDSADIAKILYSGSNTAENSLELVTKKLATFFGVTNADIPEFVDTNSKVNRNKYHETIAEIKSAINSRTYVVSAISDTTASLTAQDTDPGRASRYALINLLPFTISGDFTGTAAADPMYNLNDPMGSRLFSDAYFADKAEMLHAMLERNTDDLKYAPVQPIGNAIYYDDHVTGEQFITGQLDLPGNTQALDEFEVNRVVFGDDTDNTFIQGGVESDRLFGQGGNDTLTGAAGNDYLEGGRGADQFIWNTGDGDDFIGDYDDGGDRVIINGIDLATLSFNQTSANSSFYTDSSNPDITLRYDGGALEINVGSGPDKGIITVNEYLTAAGANYGIVLSPFTVAPPTGDNIVHLLGTSNDPADNETRVSAYDRKMLAQRGLDWANTSIRFNAVDVANYAAGTLHGTYGGAFEGGPVDDHLTGDVGSNALHGWAGNDLIEGGTGDDFLEGGAGSDNLFGGAGDDLIFGSARAGLADALSSGSAHDQFYLTQIASDPLDINILDGGPGNDHVSGGEYTDYLDGGSGVDYLLGGTGNDFINGGDDRDVIYGDSALNYRYVELTPGVASEQLEIAFADGGDNVGQYDDVIVAGAGNDTVWGELGSDDIHGGEGDDNLIGDRFNDAAYFAAELPAYSGTSPDLASVLHGDDKLYGEAGSDLLLGNGGDDFLSGGVGVDSLLGGAGNDTYYSRPGDGLDYIEDAEGTHTLLFDDVAMDDLQIVFQSNQVRVTTKLGSHGFYFNKDQWADTQIALGPTETVIERSRLDTFYLDDIGNVLLTVVGTDDLSEAERNDIFSIDDSDPNKPRVIVSSQADNVEIEGFLQEGGGAKMRIGSGALQFSVDMTALQILTGFEFLSLADGLIASLINFSGSITGSPGDDRIVGSGSADTIGGLSGNDILEGRAGDDSLDGGTGDDLLLGGEGDDDLYGGAGHDRDLLNGGPGNDELNGSFGPDVYQFKAGDGQDLLKDPNGSHYFEFGAGVDLTSVALYFTGTTDTYFRLEYGSGDAVRSQGVTAAHWINELYVNGVEVPLVLRSDLTDGVFRDTRADDVFETQGGNDTVYVQAWGDNAFRISTGDGQDTIEVDDGYQPTRMGEIRFAADVDLSTLAYSFANGAATINYGDSDQISLNPDAVFSISDNTFMRFTLVSEADPNWIPTITPTGSGASLYGSFGTDNIVGDEGLDVIYPGYGNDIITAGGGNDRIVLNDIYMYQGTTGIGYKEISGGTGDDLITTPLHQGLTFNYAQGDGSDTIFYDWAHSNDAPYHFDIDWELSTVAFNPKGQDVLSFGTGITLTDLSFTRVDNALLVNMQDGSGGVRVENFFSAWDSADVPPPGDLFDLFGEGPSFSTLLEPYILTLLPKTPIAALEFADGSRYDMTAVLNALLEVTPPGQVIEGTSGADILTGTAGDDTITGGRGADTMSGGAGDDIFIVEGRNQGKDIINGGDGFDSILGGEGDDRIRLKLFSGSDRVERIDGGDGLNTIAGTNRRNTLDFSATELLNIARIEAQGGRDTVIGSESDDVIVGGAGNDILEGRGGNDIFIVEGSDQGKDRINGGEGFDTISGGAGDDQITLKGLTLLDSIERIDGGLGINTLVGTQAKNTLDFSATELINIARIEGGARRDFLTGSQGDDVIVGGTGNDVLSGEGGNDTYVFNLGDGRDKIVNKDANPDSFDSLDIIGVDYDALWLSRSGNNLLVDVVGSDDQVKIKNWFTSDKQQLDIFQAGDRVLLRNQVDLLVSAMASYDVPVGVGAIIPADTRAALDPVLASVWEAA